MDPLCTARQGLLPTRCHTLLYRGFAWFCWNAKTEEIPNKKLFHRDPLLFRIPGLHSANVCILLLHFLLLMFRSCWIDVDEQGMIIRDTQEVVIYMYIYIYIMFFLQITRQRPVKLPLRSNSRRAEWAIPHIVPGFFAVCHVLFFLDICMIDWMVYMNRMSILSSYGCVSSRVEYLQYVWYIWELGMMENYRHFSHPKMCKV